MPKQNQVIHTNSDNKSGRKADTAAEPIGSVDSLVDAQNAPLIMTGISLKEQAVKLKYPHLQTAQRIAIVARLGQLQGNRDLQRIIGTSQTCHPVEEPGIIFRQASEEEGAGEESSAAEEILSGAINDFVETLADDYIPYYKYTKIAITLGKAFGEGLQAEIERAHRTEEWYASLSPASGIYEDKPGQRRTIREHLAVQARAPEKAAKAFRAAVIKMGEAAITIVIDEVRGLLAETAVRELLEELGEKIGNYIEKKLPDAFSPKAKKYSGDFVANVTQRIGESIARSTAAYAQQAIKPGKAPKMDIRELLRDVFKNTKDGLADIEGKYKNNEWRKNKIKSIVGKTDRFQQIIYALDELREKEGDKEEMSRQASEAIKVLKEISDLFLPTVATPGNLDDDIKALEIFKRSL